MQHLGLRIVLSTSIAALAVACGGEKATKGAPEPAKAAPKAAPESKAPAKAAAAPKVKQLDEAPPDEKDRYALSIEPPSGARAGEKAVVSVRVTPKAPWHMNLDFPTSLELSPPADVTVPKTKLKKADAKQLDENAAAFDVEITPTAPGSKSFSGTFKFAVCQEEACSPVTETITFSVDVAPSS